MVEYTALVKLIKQDLTLRGLTRALGFDSDNKKNRKLMIKRMYELNKEGKLPGGEEIIIRYEKEEYKLK